MMRVEGSVLQWLKRSRKKEPAEKHGLMQKIKLEAHTMLSMMISSTYHGYTIMSIGG
jgi:hypothetical protein